MSSQGRGIGGHTSPYEGKNDEWLTPPSIIRALGPFGLDPCAPITRPWATASQHYTREDDGLAQDWVGFVWCNPPYGPDTWKWLRRLARHPAGGIALTFARTETVGFFETVWRMADSLFFIEGRLFFHDVEGRRAPHNSGGPSVLIGYGDEATRRLSETDMDGMFVALTPSQTETPDLFTDAHRVW